MSSSIQLAKSNWPEKVRKIKELEALARDLEKYKDAITSMTALRGELAWAIVHQKEQDVLQYKSQVEDLGQKTQAIENWLQDYGSSMDRINEERAEAVKEQNAINEIISILKNSIRLKEAEARSIESEIVQIDSELKEVNTEISSNKKKAEDFKTKNETCSKSQNEEIQSLQNKKSQKANEIKEVDKSLNELYESSDELFKAQQLKDSQIVELEQQNRELDRELVNLKLRKNQIESSKNNRIKIFGDKMADVLSLIEKNADHFHRKPIGPIGLYTSLKEGCEKWCNTIEAIIGRELDHFIVHDYHDCKALQNLFKKIGSFTPPGILIVNFDDKISVDLEKCENSAKAVNGSALLASSILGCQSDIILRTLIINSGIERIMLLEDNDLAIQIMSRSPKITCADYVYTLTHQVRGFQNSVSCFPLYASSSGRLHRDVGSLLRYSLISLILFSKCDSELIIVHDKINRNNALLTVYKSDLSKIREQIMNMKGADAELRRKKQLLQREIEDIDTQLASLIGGDDRSYSEEIRICEAKIDRLMEQFKSIASRKIDQNAKLHHLRKSVESEKTACEEQQSHFQEISESIILLQKKRSEMEAACVKNNSSHSKLSAQLSDLKSSWQDEIIILEAIRRDALEFSNEITSTRCISVVEEELNRLASRIDESKKRNHDFSKIKRDLVEAQNSYEQSRREVLLGEALLKEMSHALEKRERSVEAFRNVISKTSIVEFVVLLSARGFKGGLDYNHESRELSISIKTNGYSEDLLSTDVKQLSGGEKSFGTSCFLLSLWGSLASPIRCLDEFDVFMDAINRRMILEMIVGQARSGNFQFILVTPIPLNDFLLENPDINVIRMPGIRDTISVQ